ncbi:glycosyltransferase [bacterium]|nr:glycosyltransferase [bacterium]
MNMLILILALTYAMILVFLRTGVKRLRPGKSKDIPFVSVVVAARDEEENIRACISALQRQTYPGQAYEIIISDDRSSDGTAAIVQEMAKADNRIRLVRIRDEQVGMAPKKRALKQGIDSAKGEILLFTDADCVAEPGWISGMMRHFDTDTGLVAGYGPLTRYRSASFFEKLTALDALALAGVAAGTFGLGFPLTCSGRSLAYRRSLYDDISGFSRIAGFVSGDDDLLLHMARGRTGWKMRYCAEPGAFTETAPPHSLRQFAAQRTRHASKGFHYPAGLILGLSGVYILNVLILTGIFIPALRSGAAAGFLVKCAAEFMLIHAMAGHVGQRSLLRVFPAAMFLHVPYVVLFGLWGQIGRFEWKRSRFGKKMDGG